MQLRTPATFTVAAFLKEGVVVRLFWCIDLSRTAEIRFYTCLQLRDSRLPLASKARQREVLRAQYRYSRFVNKLYAFGRAGPCAFFTFCRTAERGIQCVTGPGCFCKLWWNAAVPDLGEGAGSENCSCNKQIQRRMTSRMTVSSENRNARIIFCQRPETYGHVRGGVCVGPHFEQYRSLVQARKNKEKHSGSEGTKFIPNV